MGLVAKEAKLEENPSRSTQGGVVRGAAPWDCSHGIWPVQGQSLATFLGCNVSAMGTWWEGAGLSLSRVIGVKSSLSRICVGKQRGQGAFLEQKGGHRAFLGVLSILSGPVPVFLCPFFSQTTWILRSLGFLIICHSFFQSYINIPLFDAFSVCFPRSHPCLRVFVGF